MQRNNSKFFLTLLALLLLTVGCNNSDRDKALKAYVEDVKGKSIGQVEPLPEVKPYELFTYSAENLRSPFVPMRPEETLADLPSNNGIRPDVNRRREVLESYPIDTLRMLGTLEKENHIWAVVVDSDGAVHRIQVGNYVGQNHGRVKEVSEEKTTVTEIIPDGRGGWIEREASLALTVE